MLVTAIGVAVAVLMAIDDAVLADENNVYGSNSTQQDKWNGKAEICFTGFVMDQFCIKRGTLLDRPSVVSLEGPELHTVHCLVDIGVCIDSGYELLLDDADGDGVHRRAYVLDDVGNELVLSVARRWGADCDTCTGEGNITQGFRATVRGFIEPDDSIPPRLNVTTLDAATASGCGEEGSFLPQHLTTTSSSSAPSPSPSTSSAASPPPTSSSSSSQSLSPSSSPFLSPSSSPSASTPSSSSPSSSASRTSRHHVPTTVLFFLSLSLLFWQP